LCDSGITSLTHHWIFQRPRHIEHDNDDENLSQRSYVSLSIQPAQSLSISRMSKHRPRTARPSKPPHTIEFIPGRIDSPDDFPRPSIYLDSETAARSAYLRTRIHPQEHNGPISRIELSSANPKAFQIYANWLETGLVAVPIRQAFGAATTAPKSLSWRDCEVLVKAHILGSQFGDEAFQDCVMNVLVRSLEPEQDRDRRVCELVFGRQASGVSQKLKCLVVDRMFAGEMEGEELLALFVKRVLGGKVGDHGLGESCEYHVHAGERCDGHADGNDFAAPTADTIINSLLRGSRTRSRRKHVPDPWNFSARSRIPRIFDEICLEPSPQHSYPDFSDLPPPIKVHPSLLQGLGATSRSHGDEMNSDEQRESRAPSRRQGSLYLPPQPPPLPPQLHPSVLQGLAPNTHLPVDKTRSRRRPSTAAEAQESQIPRERSWPTRPPTPFQKVFLPNETTSRPTSQHAASCTPSPEDWPLRNDSLQSTTRPLSQNEKLISAHRPDAIPFPPTSFAAISTVPYTSPNPTTRTSTKKTPHPLPLNPGRKSAPPYCDRPLPPLPPPSTPSTSPSSSPNAPPSPIFPIRKQESWPRLPASLHPGIHTSTPAGTLKRKPAPDNGLEFLARYPEGETLISRARKRSFGPRDGRVGVRGRTILSQYPVELQGRAVRVAELLREEGSGRPGTA